MTQAQANSHKVFGHGVRFDAAVQVMALPLGATALLGGCNVVRWAGAA